ncbi:hypothetical protein OQZ33_06990 [Pedobacter sp. MC2016-05]|uniref:hypothetical protein n=1 Tax=Pedobacter sp. MC2016-05 TaxID=2994474 RepID=UPI00224864EE|nr:hypothetical protein [Pedobacter sp. MC2016-05]MCX2474070.1 hypothetical protein [Pedobacter sp. MC2016-05]
MKAIENGFLKFDKIGLDIVSQLIKWDSFNPNEADKYGWYDADATRGDKKYKIEIKCNDSVQLQHMTTIITKKDFDDLTTNSTDGTPLYFIVTNRCTFAYNLAAVANDADVFEVKQKENRNTSMGNNGYYRLEEWVYIDRIKARNKGYMKLIKRGGKHFNYNIDLLLKGG